jgi:predicted phosphodiesterase
MHGSRLLQAEYRESFEQDLRRLHARSGPWDLVLISGDLTLTGSPREFGPLDAALRSLWELFRALGSEPCLLAVPGNHDLRREGTPGPPDLGVRHRALEARKAFQTMGSSKVRQSIRKGFAPFIDWFSGWRHTHPAPKLHSLRQGLLPGDFAATVASEGLTVGVVGLNSNFRSCTREGLTERNEIDVEQVEKAIGLDVREWAGRHDALLLLTHHPPSRLREELLTGLGERLAVPGRPLLHLCGGRHAEGNGLVGVPRQPWSLCIHASTLFSELPSTSGPPEEQRWGYIAGRLELAAGGGQLELLPRSASWRQGEVVLGPDPRAGARESLDYSFSELLGAPPLGTPPGADRAAQAPECRTEAEPRPRETRQAPPAPGTPLRILHLSDLHVEAGDDPLSLFQPLLADLRDKEGLGIERLDHLVISGDITQRATPQEFQKACAFVSELLEHFALPPQRCVFVPGNHDLDWNTEVYTWRKKRQLGNEPGLAPGSFYEQGDDYFIRDEQRYPERFKNFSEHFYKPLLGVPYPLPPEQQCLSFFFGDSRLQFLALNSAWRIDDHFTERASIDERALSRGLLEAARQLEQARVAGQLADDGEVLRMAVFHHPITGNEKIQEDAFVDRLLQADVRVCLHGHVHEDRADLVQYTHPRRRLHVMGAGSFGASLRERPESVPRLYNVLEVAQDLRGIRVHVRSRRKQGGAWGPEARWPTGRPHERCAYYDVALT